jgi:hypothetical protein
MSLLSSIASTTCRRSLISTSTTNKIILPSLSARWYTGPQIIVQHYESGRTVEDAYKGTDKYCVQTFNKISEIVRTLNNCLILLCKRFVVKLTHIIIVSLYYYSFLYKRVFPSFQRMCMMSFQRRKLDLALHML